MLGYAVAVTVSGIAIEGGRHKLHRAGGAG